MTSSLDPAAVPRRGARGVPGLGMLLLASGGLGDTGVTGFQTSAAVIAVLAHRGRVRRARG